MMAIASNGHLVKRRKVSVGLRVKRHLRSLLHADTTANAKELGDKCDLVRRLYLYAQFT
jgi:hypothetical protein